MVHLMRWHTIDSLFLLFSHSGLVLMGVSFKIPLFDFLVPLLVLFLVVLLHSLLYIDSGHRIFRASRFVHRCTQEGQIAQFGGSDPDKSTP